jgi:hypothetical protein
MFSVGTLVKVDIKQISFMGIPEEEIGGLLVVNDVITEKDWNGQPLLEVRNSDGDYYGFNQNVLEAV